MYESVETYYDLIYPHEELATAFSGAMPIVLNKLGRNHGLRILDLCCGTGRGLHLFADLPDVSVCGVDQNSTMLAKAAARFRGRFIQKDILRIQPNELDEKKFDVVVITGVSLLHFSPEQRNTIYSLVANVLRSGGLFIFDVLRKRQVTNDGNETLLKREFSVQKRQIIVVYYRTYDDDKAVHHNLVIELSEEGHIKSQLNHDYFSFYPITPSEARTETLGFGFRDLGELPTTYVSSTFQWLSRA